MRRRRFGQRRRAIVGVRRNVDGPFEAHLVQRETVGVDAGDAIAASPAVGAPAASWSGRSMDGSTISDRIRCNEASPQTDGSRQFGWDEASMELPFNTTISQNLLSRTGRFAEPVANWSTKRRWVQEAFEALEGAGYHVGSFGHVNGVHIQNMDTWETYSDAIHHGEIPLNRGYRPTDEERMIRELQLRLGSDAAHVFPRQVTRDGHA
jgi:hypothetical protein